ncbi:MAG: hypothetical protein M1824_001556 [Vezdaea acicularis]|nr:MAG: hypothetical protein M1824_001556 [Vezdaea acicularis]
MSVKKVYIGPSLSFRPWSTAITLAVFQMCAKLQELLMIISMTPVIIQVIRHQLLHGDGLPLGLVASGFTFTRLSSMRSRAMYTWKGLQTGSAKAQRTLVVLSIFVITALATVAGPASAVLMLPRQTDRIVYTRQFWLNGSLDDLFPTTLNATHIGDISPSDNGCTQPNSFIDTGCISVAYQKLQALFDSAPSISHWDWTFITREPSFARVVAVQEKANGSNPETWARTPHAATAYVQNLLWWDPSWWIRFKESENGRRSTVRSQSASVRTACTWQAIAVNTTEVNFPTLEAHKTYLYDLFTPMAIKPSTWSYDNKSFIGPDIVRTVWIEDAQAIDSVTAGLMVLAPLKDLKDSSRSALACLIDARWTESDHIQADGLLDIAISSELVKKRHQNPRNTDFGFLTDINSGWQSIKATLDWLEPLTPTVPYLTPSLNLSTPASTIGNLLMKTNNTYITPITSVTTGYQDSPYVFWEKLIAAYFADGVSRVGFARQLESNSFVTDGSKAATAPCLPPTPERVGAICPRPPPQDGQFTALNIRGVLTDIYAYHASATTDYLSIAALIFYVIIATAHLSYTLIRRRSSRAWERLEDLLALVHSSRPAPDVLSNTCAGMKALDCRAKNVKIVIVGGKSGEIRRDGGDEEEGAVELGEKREGTESGEEDADADAGEGGGGEAVQMVFVESMHRRDAVYGIVEAGVKYGKME